MTIRRGVTYHSSESTLFFISLCILMYKTIENNNEKKKKNSIVCDRSE